MTARRKYAIVVGCILLMAWITRNSDGEFSLLGYVLGYIVAVIMILVLSGVWSPREKR